MTPAVRRARTVLRDAGRALRGRDLSLWAAGVTFFGLLAVVPLLLIALRGAAVLVSPEFVQEGLRRWGEALPPQHRPAAALDALASAALGSSWTVLLVALLPATFYGEGLRRGMTQVAAEPAGALVGWKGRLAFAPVLLMSPVLVVVLLGTTDLVAGLYTAGGWTAVLGVVVSFHVDWLVLSAVLCAVFLANTPSGVRRRYAVVCAFSTGAVLAGFLHGFLLFLAIPIDWSIPFGGLVVVGAVAALGLWLYLLHVLVLFAHRLLLSTERTRAGRRPPVEPPPGD
ncbi:YhjD/YihY/BrkB family envelope integrity protein [Umezawaea beigongshangensis]|uniref:YhjD/YihY/BrkB family envelope integrity protein n=1 Tax=Umezawaea beigongshangensis TaxID=2780383 RepID=UPI0018F22281|nr:YhjD/YihY/BrkB family envelope integrity protein [Umezawaea beigongshangensis]